MDIIELNEAFAAQALTCTRELGLADDDPRINPLGGAIALGHPLGMSGARLATTAVHQLRRSGKRRALCTMCIGVGQGIAMVLEGCGGHDRRQPPRGRSRPRTAGLRRRRLRRGELSVRPRHLNIGGLVHGGVLCSLLDTAMARAFFMADGGRTSRPSRSR
jgi:hypothetical protein